MINKKLVQIAKNISFRNFSSVHKVVFVRHGESQWNKENRFTGWTNVPLSDVGITEARSAGRLLKKEGYEFDFVFTSVLRRAIQTYFHLADELDILHLPMIKSWRLNERHYGALQGLNKAETAQQHGEEQVKIWRRSYDIPPPPLDINDPRAPSFDPIYKNWSKNALPLTESLKDTVNRCLPFWHDDIGTRIKQGQRVIVVAHGNSLRSIVKYLDNISEQDIIGLNIPTGVPLVYELNEDLKPLRKYYLGDQEELQKKIQSVANQGKAQK